MIKQLFISLFFTGTLITAFAQDKAPYTLYNADGKKVTYKKMMKVLKEKEIVMFGEFHNNAISHWLQLAVTKDLQ
jgi:uncharacterized iron-regulated protein